MVSILWPLPHHCHWLDDRLDLLNECPEDGGDRDKANMKARRGGCERLAKRENLQMLTEFRVKEAACDY